MKFKLPSLLLVLCIACTSSPDQEKQIDAIVDPVIKPGSAGLTIAVAEGDKILFSKGYGSANPEYDIPNSPGTIFHVASVSKQFTAFAIALLADQGKISLDDDIRKYLPELKDFGTKISIKHLVHHTSGLRDQWNLLALAGWRLDDVITRDQVLRVMRHQEELNFQPGTEFTYCNTGYTLLGEIVSRISGMSFPDWCKSNIFEPLEMDNTFFYDDHEKIVRNRAYSFYDSPDGLKKSVLSYANAGATSLFTTAEDLTKWSNNFYTMKVGNANVMEQMEERVILTKGDTMSYAFGQVISEHRGYKSISHGGADAGYRSMLQRFPEKKLSVVVLSNLASANTGELASKIADLYLAGDLKDDAPKPEVKKTTTFVKVNETLLKKYEGQYQLNNEMILTFKSDAGKFTVQATGQPAIELAAVSDSEFVIEQYGVRIVFDKPESDVVKQLTFTQGGQTIIAPRAKALKKDTVDQNQFVGTYFSPELQTSYTIELKNDTLRLNHIRHDPAPLRPVGKDAYATNVWFMSNIDFVRDQKANITGMKVSSGRVRNVRFVKQPAAP